MSKREKIFVIDAFKKLHYHLWIVKFNQAFYDHLVSLLNGKSTFVSYLMPKPSPIEGYQSKHEENSQTGDQIHLQQYFSQKH